MLLMFQAIQEQCNPLTHRSISDKILCWFTAMDSFPHFVSFIVDGLFAE